MRQRTFQKSSGSFLDTRAAGAAAREISPGSRASKGYNPKTTRTQERSQSVLDALDRAYRMRGVGTPALEQALIYGIPQLVSSEMHASTADEVTP